MGSAQRNPWIPRRLGTLVPPHPNGTWLGLYGRDALAADAAVPAEGSGFESFALAHNVHSEAQVERVMEQALKAGAILALMATLEVDSGHNIERINHLNASWLEVTYVARNHDKSMLDSRCSNEEIGSGVPELVTQFSPTTGNLYTDRKYPIRVMVHRVFQPLSQCLGEYRIAVFFASCKDH